MLVVDEETTGLPFECAYRMGDAADGIHLLLTPVGSSLAR